MQPHSLPFAVPSQFLLFSRLCVNNGRIVADWFNAMPIPLPIYCSCAQNQTVNKTPQFVAIQWECRLWRPRSPLHLHIHNKYIPVGCTSVCLSLYSSSTHPQSQPLHATIMGRHADRHEGGDQCRNWLRIIWYWILVYEPGTDWLGGHAPNIFTIREQGGMLDFGQRKSKNQYPPGIHKMQGRRDAACDTGTDCFGVQFWYALASNANACTILNGVCVHE